MKLTVTKTTSSTIEGTIAIKDLSPGLLDALRIDPKVYPEETIECMGSYRTEWDDDIPMPQIEGWTIFGALNGQTHKYPTGKEITKCELSGCEIHRSIYSDVPSRYSVDLAYDEIENWEEIEQDLDHYGDWETDRISSAMDYERD